LEWIAMMTAAVSSAIKSRAALQLENIALHHQIGVLQRSAKKCPSFENAERLFWIGLSCVWAFSPRMRRMKISRRRAPFPLSHQDPDLICCGLKSRGFGKKFCEFTGFRFWKTLFMIRG
jgi:hypothetical protein